MLILLATTFYIITWLLIYLNVKTTIKAPEASSKTNKLYFVTWAVALVAHLLIIIVPLTNNNGLNVNFVSLGSYVMWFLSLILFISTLRRKIQALAVVILPFTILSLTLMLAIGGGDSNNIQINSGLGFHILVSLLAYSTLMLAAVQALLVATQNNYLHQRLKNPNQSSFVRTLPALEDMEYFLFHLIALGVLLLSISLFSGFYYLDNLFGSSVAHKTILSIISWIVFSALLLGRWKYGWRGKTAVRWTISGFAILALAFFGSKFIQEFVLDKAVAARYEQPYFNHKNMIKKAPPYFYPVFPNQQLKETTS